MYVRARARVLDFLFVCLRHVCVCVCACVLARACLERRKQPPYAAARRRRLSPQPRDDVGPDGTGHVGGSRDLSAESTWPPDVLVEIMPSKHGHKHARHAKTHARARALTCMRARTHTHTCGWLDRDRTSRSCSSRLSATRTRTRAHTQGSGPQSSHRAVQILTQSPKVFVYYWS